MSLIVIIILLVITIIILFILVIDNGLLSRSRTLLDSLHQRLVILSFFFAFKYGTTIIIITNSILPMDGVLLLNVWTDTAPNRPLHRLVMRMLDPHVDSSCRRERFHVRGEEDLAGIESS